MRRSHEKPTVPDVVITADYKVTDDGNGKPRREPAIYWKNLAWFLLFFAALVAWRYQAITS